MIAATDTLVIGAGQAGLAMSRCLTDRGHEHLVLERGRVAQRWRSERWDSFTLLSPNWQTRLPGHRYRGTDPEGFMTAEQVADFLERYARDAPVRTGIAVHRLEPVPSGWRARTSAGDVVARQVVVATGDLDRPQAPPLARTLPAAIAQLHSSAYRNPGQLPEGPVLVVGAGPSGQQIAEELARAGRRVHLAVGRHKSLPRRYRGHDTYWWMDRMGILARTVDSLPDGRFRRGTPNAVLAGGRELDLRRLVATGVVPHGRLIGVGGGRLRFAGDLATNLAAAEDNAYRFRERVDAWVQAHGKEAPAERVPRLPQPGWACTGETALRVDEIGTVLWATGFRRDFSWIDAPVFDADGEPVQRRGVTAAEGLFFLGLRWMFRRSSSFLDGVGADAEHLATRIAADARTHAA
jgi:putative flavoprotein involved in K+ transport